MSPPRSVRPEPPEVAPYHTSANSPNGLPRLFYDRERALWTPGPGQLLPLAEWMHRSGVRTLVVVTPHAPGRLPEAIKRGLASEQTIARAVAVMSMLNRVAGEVMAASQAVFAATDVTGFGLLGHLSEMLGAGYFGALNDKQKDAIMGAIPMKRMGSCAEIASAVTYLASSEAAYVTGQTLHVNGGMAMI